MEENRENWKKMFGTVPTSNRKKKRLVERWHQETAYWSVLSEDEKVALLDMELCCQDLHEIAVKQPLYYPKECYGLFIRCMVTASRAEREVLERKNADVEVLIQEFFRWIDRNSTKEAEKPVEHTVGKGRQGLRRECLQERIRWVLTSAAEDQRSWIPFQLLLMVVTLGSQVWNYPETGREITVRHPRADMHVPAKRINPDHERLLHLWLLQNLMDLFELPQEERIPLWTRYLQIQGIGMVSHEEERFWRHVLRRQYELLPCIGCIF